MIRARRAPGVLLALVALLAGCRKGAAPPEPPVDGISIPRVAATCEDRAREGASLLLVLPDCEPVEDRVPVVAVAVAATYPARERGLGGIDHLPDGEGMLFVYPESRGRSFWMKDCLIGLDIAFLDDDGRIVDLATLAPGVGLTGADVPRHASTGPARYVLEVRARWMEERGIRVGDLVDLGHVTDGVRPE